MNALRTAGGLIKSQVLSQPVPVAMTLALTYRCNLRCRYCQIWKEAGEELSTRQVLAAIDELTDAGMSRLGLTGGEPLLRPDLAVIVEHAKHRDLFTTVFTNGALVDGHLDTLRRLDAVLLSLDGPREAHDATRGRGAFDATLHALEVLSAEGVPVWTNTVLTTRNIEAVDFVLEVAERYGALAAFQPVFEHSYSVKGEKVDELRAEESQYRRVIDLLLERKRAGAPLLNSVPFFEYVRTPSWEQNPRRCLAGKTYGAISPEGRVAPCPVLLQAPDLPDGRVVGFAEAFRRTGRRINCKGCFCIATVESDLLFSFDPGAVANTLRHLLRRRRRPGTRRGPAVEECAAGVALSPAPVESCGEAAPPPVAPDAGGQPPPASAAPLPRAAADTRGDSR